ncbi:CapA family protein [Vibrio alfacsensis]|uniref:CapA family protein n=1 Tax=Vibrio alfacsensis TaxID=1074311 RepID=UPI002ADE7727|nr:CapA family protein [Vibrio alfacsensis]WQE76440.1 CapA family protein [Vibrio alfacsensis]
MIFTGDVAIADDDKFSFVGFEPRMLSKPWVINLEGAILTDGKAYPEWGVYNSKEWQDSFRNFNIGAIFIGNNHICDLDKGIEDSIDCFINQGLNFFGGGKNIKEAKLPVQVESDGLNYVMLGFGWPVIGCKVAKRSSGGVNRFERKEVIKSTKQYLKTIGSDRLVVVIHGNYEFEAYPQPGHRKIAKELIDLGAYSVIFHHPHIVGNIERYKDRTIAYSLGNWAFSYGQYFGGKLKFPVSSFKQIALELGMDGDIVHHTNFIPPNNVEYKCSEFVNSSDFSLRPEFEGFNDAEYLRWFKKNRVKKKGLPIYLNANDTISNRLRNQWVFCRQILVDKASKLGLKKMRSE